MFHSLKNIEKWKELHILKGIIENILEITKKLKDEDLTEEEIKYFNQKRDDLRTILKEDKNYKFI